MNTLRMHLMRRLAVTLLVASGLTLGVTGISDAAHITPLIPIEPPEKEVQEITFTTEPPSSATVGGPTYQVAATTNSGKSVTFSSGAPSVCSVAPSTTNHATVSFVGVGTCKVVAKATGNTLWTSAQEEQSFAVGKSSQVITFTSTAPSSATVGGPTYAVTATGGGSGLPVALMIDAASGSVCSISGSTVSFIGVGTCTIDANQAGDTNYSAAPEAQQSFAVASAPTGAPTSTGTSTATGTANSTSTSTSSSTPNSNFSLLGNAAVNPKTGAITFNASVGDPGTFSWLLTFQNGKFGAFQSRTTKCKTAQVKLKGRCRPAKIIFGKGSTAVLAAGIVSFTVTPNVSARAALTHALKTRQRLPVTATLTFQSSRGGSPISHTQSITDTLKTKG
jgi:hypothetical protein